MAARLGQVLYWASLLIGACIAAIGLYFGTSSGFETPVVIFFAGSVVAIVLIGRAFQYILAGR